MPFQKRVALSGSHREPAATAAQTRPVGNGELMQVTVVLRSQAQWSATGEEFAYTDPGTVNYFPRQQLGLIHGAANTDIEAVEAFAHDCSLTVSGRSRARRSVVLVGTAENMQNAFGTTLAHYDSSEGSHRGRTGPVMIPEELEPVVTAVLGLDNRPAARPKVWVRPAGGEGQEEFSPAEVARMYNFPRGDNGAGQTIGIIELGGGYRSSDLYRYFQGLGIAAPAIAAVSVNGGVNQAGVDPDADCQVMLDLAVAGAVAPGARIVVYFAPNTGQGLHDALTCAVHDKVNQPSVVSIGWGSPETGWTRQALKAMLEASMDAAAVGATITAAAGAAGAPGGVPDVNVDLPAALPSVLACGGTLLAITGGMIASETAWNPAGGGVSRLFACPAYQNAASVPSRTGTSRVGRAVPDVAAVAGLLNCYTIPVDGKKLVVGGTSAAAPLWAGLIALLNQQLGRPVGFVNPMLYRIGTSAFRYAAAGHYVSGPTRWDEGTGLGSPNGAALAEAFENQVPTSSAGT